MAKAKLLDKDGQPIEETKAVALRDEATVAKLPDGRANMLKILAQAAADPQCQPEKMRVLLDMHKEIEADAARAAFFADFGRMQDELPIIDKDSKIIVEGKGGKKGGTILFASFENLLKIVKPICRRHHFTLWFEPGIGADERLTIRTHLVHDKGHEITCIIPLWIEDSGAKNKAQGTGSSISYGKRYGLIAVTAIISHAPEDKDDDANAGKRKVTKVADAQQSAGEVLITKAQEDALVKEIERCGVPTAKVFEKYGIERISDLPADMFQAAMTACKDYAAAIAQKAKTHGEG